MAGITVKLPQKEIEFRISSNAQFTLLNAEN